MTGEAGLLTGLVQRVLQVGLEAEMSDHLGYEPHEPKGRGSGNSRNGTGMSCADIGVFLEESYGQQVSKDTISRITDRIVDDMNQWSTRPLGSLYPVILIDAIVVKIRDQFDS